MRGFQSFMRPKIWLSLVAAGSGAVASGFVLKAHCESEFSWDPNTPTNIQGGYPKWDYDWDKRQPYSLVLKNTKQDSKSEEKYHEQLEKSKSKACRTLYLIRVGEYDENKPECEQTLTQTGKDQIALVGKRLAGIIKQKDSSFKTLVCSQSPVAQQSAALLQKSIGQKDLKIKECDPLLEEGIPALPEPQSPTMYPEPKKLYLDGSRIEAAFRKYFYRAEPEQEHDSYEIIVADANVIRYFICRAMQFPAQGWLRMMLAHGSINVISINPKGGVVLRGVGESGFLPPNQLTA